jgi:NAD(P)-dependent dehydrogenase (short-subunit alcohol dehydrogenase family)
LVEDGGSVVLVARDEDKLARRQKELESFGKGKVETIVVDFYDWESVKALSARIDIETRHINRLVNAAGYLIPKTFPEYTEADYNGYMDLNRAGGSIVNIGAMWAHQAIKATPSSACSMQKAGLHALTKNLAMELGAHGVRVNAVAPAVTVTPLFNAFIDPKKVEQTLIEGFSSFHPIGRVGRPEDIANHIVFLLSDKSSWTTGAVHNVDGGVMAGRV